MGNEQTIARQTIAQLLPESETARAVNIERVLNTPGAWDVLDILPDFLAALETLQVNPVTFMQRILERIDRFECE